MSTDKSSFSEIPTIDLALAGNPASLPRVLHDLRYALIEVGFLYIAHHGVSEDVMARLTAALPTLFALPPEAKAAVALENSPHFLGYSAPGRESTAGRPDFREQVEFATELPDDWRAGDPLYDRLRGPNQWPPGLPELRQIVTDYIESLTALSERFLMLVARALSLPADVFLPFLSDQHRLKLIHYPSLPADSASVSDQGVGPHKDSSGWWTFLLQASPPEVPGLQALNKAGQWIDVPAKPGTLVVNIGQAFEVVTDGVCKATTHRVLLSGGSRERYSVPFFQGVRRSLTKYEAQVLRPHFASFNAGVAEEPAEGRLIDSAFLRGRYDTWGEAQLRTKIRSHRENGRKFYADVYEQYMHDDISILQ
ncbi:hypothetical protein G7054_g3931 [Neopestalotiopsis clavispora]|nr:hypothetical protein G7054_g3931 [Neopestalotiopsis clavispora]